MAYEDDDADDVVEGASLLGAGTVCGKALVVFVPWLIATVLCSTIAISSEEKLAITTIITTTTMTTPAAPPYSKSLPTVVSDSTPPVLALSAPKQVAGKWMDATQGSKNTLYCFMVILPFGYERIMVKAQYDRGVSIFGCDAHAVFSNESFALSDSNQSERTVAFGGTMKVKINTWTWAQYNVKLALNSEVFNRVWKKLWSLGTWRNYDWTLKTEADTIFLPGRLQHLLTLRPLVPDAAAATEGSNCGTCSPFGRNARKMRKRPESCPQHVQWYQNLGTSCPRALQLLSRLPPADCGCRCGTSVCRNPDSVYLRNCKTNAYQPGDPLAPALHGPLEVLSKAAVHDFEKGFETCDKKLTWSYKQWGEDWFLEHCLQLLGVNAVDSFTSLADGDCDPHQQWSGHCFYKAAAFQPFKTPESYFKCLHEAENGGKWPPTGWEFDNPPF